MKKIKSKKGITFIALIITIVVMLILAAVTIGIAVDGNKIYEDEKVNTQETKAQQNCEHDWVITSEYDFMHSSYRTVSKCSKCGKVVK